jgi:predicted metal-dependent RNase
MIVLRHNLAMKEENPPPSPQKVDQRPTPQKVELTESDRRTIVFVIVGLLLGGLALKYFVLDSLPDSVTSLFFYLLGVFSFYSLAKAYIKTGKIW